MEIKDKLKKILPHWLEHNKKHEAEFLSWIVELEKDGEQELAGQLQKAVGAFVIAQQALEKTVEMMGGIDKCESQH